MTDQQILRKPEYRDPSGDPKLGPSHMVVLVSACLFAWWWSLWFSMGGVYSLWGEHGWAINNHSDYFKLPEQLNYIVAPVSCYGAVHHCFFGFVLLAYGSDDQWRAEHKRKYKTLYFALIPSVVLGLVIGIALSLVGEWHTYEPPGL